MIANTVISQTATKQASDDKILVQLKRIRGQIDGLINMYQDQRLCIDIARQILAARNSLGRVARDLLTNEAGRCTKIKDAKQLNEILKELLKY